MSAELITAFGQFGPMGLFVLYLVWERKSAREAEIARTETDKALATSLAALTVSIQHMTRGQ